jgi:heavy metal efflux system protein
VTLVLTSLPLRGKLSEKENFFIRKVKEWYEPALNWCFQNRSVVLLVSTIAVVIALAVSMFLGSEFIPRLDENAFALEMRRPPGISLEEANRQNSLIEQYLLKTFPNEIATIVSKTGRAEIATDPMGDGA